MSQKIISPRQKEIQIQKNLKKYLREVLMPMCFDEVEKICHSESTSEKKYLINNQEIENFVKNKFTKNTLDQ